MSRVSKICRAAALASTLYLGATMTVDAACVTGAALARTGDDITTLMSGGDAFLAKYDDGGSIMVRDVRDYAMSDGNAAAFLAKLAVTANDRQRASLAAGLGQAAMSCSLTDPVLAAAIQDAVAKTNDPVFQALFLAVTGTVQPTAFTSAGPATSSGLVGSFSGVPDASSSAPSGSSGGGSTSTSSGSSGGSSGSSSSTSARRSVVTSFAITPVTTSSLTGRDPTSP